LFHRRTPEHRRLSCAFGGLFAIGPGWAGIFAEVDPPWKAQWNGVVLNALRRIAELAG
jgi:hypothetical protein